MSDSLRVSVVFTTCFVASWSFADGHGFISKPAMRGGAYPNAVNGYCQHCLGQTGNFPMPICGKPFFLDYLEGPFMTLKAGEMFPVQVTITAHHMGHFFLRLCERQLSSAMAGDPVSCLNEHVLHRARPEEVHDDCQVNDPRGDCQPIDEANPGYWYLPPPGWEDNVQVAGANWQDSMAEPANGNYINHPSLFQTNESTTRQGAIYNMHYKLPKGIKCDKCTLQWAWKTANSCTPHPDAYKCHFQNMERLGWDVSRWCYGICLYKNGDCPTTQGPPTPCGEEFANCADVIVVDDGGHGGGGGGGESRPSPTPSPVTYEMCSMCKDKCTNACSHNLKRNQCWGEPHRYIECICLDGSRHMFDGCKCEHQDCPSTSEPEPEPEPEPAPKPRTTSPCKKHCGRNAELWSAKCKWKNCKGCGECSSPAPTHEPVPATPTPTTLEVAQGCGGPMRCVQDLDCDANPWCNAQGYGEWCEANKASCPSPHCICKASSCKAKPGNAATDAFCEMCSRYSWCRAEFVFNFCEDACVPTSYGTNLVTEKSEHIQTRDVKPHGNFRGSSFIQTFVEPGKLDWEEL